MSSRRTRSEARRESLKSWGIVPYHDRAGDDDIASNLISLVWLLGRHCPIELTQLHAAAERAFGRTFDPIGGPHAGPDATGAFVIEAQKPDRFIVFIYPLALRVASVEKPYFDDIAEAADRERVFAVKTAIQQHKAWLKVDVLCDVPPDDAEVALQAVGKLIAELADSHCLALLCPGTGQMAGYSPEILSALRSEQPLDAFSLPPQMQMAYVEAEDERMAAAQAEARRRWPEFVAAFEKRRPGQGFAVKVPFGEGTATRFRWVEVLRLDGDTILGQLASEESVRPNS